MPLSYSQANEALLEHGGLAYRSSLATSDICDALKSMKSSLQETIETGCANEHASAAARGARDAAAAAWKESVALAIRTEKQRFDTEYLVPQQQFQSQEEHADLELTMACVARVGVYHVNDPP